MAFTRARLPLLLCAVGVVALAGEGRARAGKNDLRLLNLCPPDQNTNECIWVNRGMRGQVLGGMDGTIPDADGQSRFRSLMSELGVAIAPRLMTPADTLGFAGFQFSAELGVTSINSNKEIGGRRYWDGIAKIEPTATEAVPRDSYLTTVGGYVRKGLWLPLPAFEFGA